MTFSKTKIRSNPPDDTVSRTTRESFAHAADGTRLYVRERPGPSGKLVRSASEGAEGARVLSSDRDTAGEITAILCDGICCDGYIWKYLWDDLSSVARVVHWNYRGHGRSAAPADPARIGIPAHADDLDCVRRHVGDGPVVLIGHSMGCQVVLEAYRQRPERVLGLVLLCGSSGKMTETFHGTDLLARVLPRLLRLAESRPGLMRSIWSRIPVQTALRVALATGEVDKNWLDPEDLVPYLEHATHMDFLLFVRMLHEAGSYAADDFLTTVDVPALVVAAQNDTFTPHQLAERMAAALPKGELVTVSNATHVAPLEQRHEVGARVSAFIASVAALA
jgi:pimeloyl-ACP methyl ester carboxylesterase